MVLVQQFKCDRISKKLGEISWNQKNLNINKIIKMDLRYFTNLFHKSSIITILELSELKSIKSTLKGHYKFSVLLFSTF